MREKNLGILLVVSVLSALLFISGTAFAVPCIAQQFEGNATYSGGTRVESASNLTVNISTTQVADARIASGYYVVQINDDSCSRAGSNISFFVNNINTGSTYLFANGIQTFLNLTVPTQASGATCNVDAACTGGYCVHRTCRSASTYCGDTYCDSGETCSSCSSDCGACATAGGGATVTPTAVEVTPVVVTDTAVISDVVSSVSAADLGLASVAAADVVITKIAEASATQTADAAAIDAALGSATETIARSALNAVKESISAGTSQPVSISKSMEVMSVKATATQRTVVASRITLSISAAKDLKNVDIIEAIPKTTASNVNEIKFSLQPTVLQADPVVRWSFDEIKAGEKKNISYTISKNLTKLESISVASAAVPVCGNAVIEAGEECDVSLGGKTCASLGYESGTLACSNCRLDKSGCGSCTEAWSCTEWSKCSSGVQTRACSDANSCGSVANKPAESQGCIDTGTARTIGIIIVIIAFVMAYFLFVRKSPKKHRHYQHHYHHRHK